MKNEHKNLIAITEERITIFTFEVKSSSHDKRRNRIITNKVYILFAIKYLKIGANRVDILTTTVVMLVSGFWGALGGVIYWAIPDRPKGSIEFIKRVTVGLAAGALTNALGGTSPFDTAGVWDTTGVGKLIGAGFVGLAAIATFLPKDLNETLRKQMDESKKNNSTSTNQT